MTEVGYGQLEEMETDDDADMEWLHLNDFKSALSKGRNPRCLVAQPKGRDFGGLLSSNSLVVDNVSDIPFECVQALRLNAFGRAYFGVVPFLISYV
mgnify:CR=1 FL=1